MEPDSTRHMLSILPYLEQLRDGTLKVRDALGPDIIVTDKEIQDSLWHHYYDIGKTVTWILSKPSF